MNQSNEIDNWLEAIFTEVERMKKSTAEWKRQGFQSKWRPVQERAKRVRDSRKKIDETINWLTNKRDWLTPEFVRDVIEPLLHPTRNTWDKLRNAEGETLIRWRCCRGHVSAC